MAFRLMIVVALVFASTGSLHAENKPFICSNCEKEVPSTSESGDKCPHCDVTWTFMTLARPNETHGRLEYIPPEIRAPEEPKRTDGKWDPVIALFVKVLAAVIVIGIVGSLGAMFKVAAGKR